MRKSLLLLGSCLFLTLSSWAQFRDNTEKSIKDCELKLKIKGTSKHDLADHEIAAQYKGVELIWMHSEKSVNQDAAPSPKSVYLVSEAMENGGMVEYIIYKEDYEEGVNAPIFPDWKSKSNKFYLADCFHANSSQKSQP